MSIQLIVGLGNIGQEYAQTRHNAGWWMLDELAATWGASFREDKKYYAEVAKANTPQGEVWDGLRGLRGCGGLCLLCGRGSGRFLLLRSCGKDLLDRIDLVLLRDIVKNHVQLVFR